MMKNVFARDENGNIKHKKPCQTPGCDWPNWHICLVGKPPVAPEILKAYAYQPKKYGQSKRSYVMTDEQRRIRSETVQRRWDEKNHLRNKQMTEYYRDNNVGYKEVGKVFGVSGATALKVLKKAEAAGELVMRKRGLNVRHTNHN